MTINVYGMINYFDTILRPSSSEAIIEIVPATSLLSVVINIREANGFLAIENDVGVRPRLYGNRLL